MVHTSKSRPAQWHGAAACTTFLPIWKIERKPPSLPCFNIQVAVAAQPTDGRREGAGVSFSARTAQNGARSGGRELTYQWCQCQTAMRAEVVLTPPFKISLGRLVARIAEFPTRIHQSMRQGNRNLGHYGNTCKLTRLIA